MIRDLRIACYLLGLPGLGDDVESTAEGLGKQIRRAGANRVVFLGNSGGGFGSILYGCLLGVAEVHSFVPRTLVDPLRPDLVNGDSARQILARIKPDRESFDRFMDLRRLVEEIAPENRPQIHIYYAEEDKMDEYHALRMRDLQGVTLHPLSGTHLVIRQMRDSGELQSILRKALGCV